jgi:hypothetical protein
LEKKSHISTIMDHNKSTSSYEDEDSLLQEIDYELSKSDIDLEMSEETQKTKTPVQSSIETNRLEGTDKTTTNNRDEMIMPVVVILNDNSNSSVVEEAESVIDKKILFYDMLMDVI